MIKFISIGLCAALWGVMAHAQVVESRPVTQDYVINELNYNNRNAKGFVMAWKVAVIQGQIAICGAYRLVDPSMAVTSRRVLRRVYVKYNGRKIMRGVTYFNFAGYGSDLYRATANCGLTGVAAPNGRFSVRLGWHGS